MKVPPKRKGNILFLTLDDRVLIPSMKVPPKRKGNESEIFEPYFFSCSPSMKVPPKRKGNKVNGGAPGGALRPSMKVPPKRKGNRGVRHGRWGGRSLNESPSEKEGKFLPFSRKNPRKNPSMKVPPKRKGNRRDLQRECVEGSGPSMKVPPKRKGNH